MDREIGGYKTWKRKEAQPNPSPTTSSCGVKKKKRWLLLLLLRDTRGYQTTPSVKKSETLFFSIGNEGGIIQTGLLL
jgi:hypothetical protein